MIQIILAHSESKVAWNSVVWCINHRHTPCKLGIKVKGHELEIYGICNDQYLSSFIGHCLKCKKPCMGIICLYDEIQFIWDHKKVFIWWLYT